MSERKKKMLRTKARMLEFFIYRLTLQPLHSTCSWAATQPIPRREWQGMPKHSLSCQVPSTDCRGGVNSTHLKYRTEGRQRGRGHSRVLVVPHSRRQELISWTTKDSRRRPLFGHRHHRETSPNRPSTEGHVSTTNQALQHRLCP